MLFFLGKKTPLSPIFSFLPPRRPLPRFDNPSSFPPLCLVLALSFGNGLSRLAGAPLLVAFLVVLGNLVPVSGWEGEKREV